MTDAAFSALVVLLLFQTLVIVVGDRRNQLGLKIIESANAIARDSSDSQLRQIHTLVNSDLTSARQGELSQALTSLVLMRKLLPLERAAGGDISEALALIAKTEERIGQLRDVVADRRVQQARVDDQLLAEMRG